MVLTTVTSTYGGDGNFTVEISSGTPQEVIDRLAILLEGRLFNIHIYILGFCFSTNAYILVKYVTTSP